MTMTDDELRTSVLAAGASFDPSDGAAAIVAAAIESTRGRTIAGRGERRHRLASTPARFAAAAAVVVAIVVLLTSLGLALRPDNGRNRVVTGAPASGFIGPEASSLGFHVTLGESKVAHDNSGTSPTGAQPVKPQSAGSLASKVVATGTISIAVASGRIQSAVDALASLAARKGGFVASSQVVAGTSGAPAHGTITLRVPEPRFAALVVAVQRVGRTTSVVTDSTDVTSEYVDYESQITALEASRAQYLEIMSKATTISQILSVQAQLNTIEVELQQLEGQRNVLDNQAAYGTLTVRLNQGAHATHHHSSIDTAFHRSISGFVSGVDGLVQGLGPAFFAILCLLALWLIGRPAWRASRRRLL